MKTPSSIDALSKAARELTPGQIREQLQKLDQEQRVLRALLRAVLKSQLPQSSGSNPTRPDTLKKVFDFIFNDQLPQEPPTPFKNL